MIAQNTIQQILSRIDIIDVVGSFVKLKRRGANYLGNCPFHNERTPSFTVSPTKEIYKCFGCGKSGNTISFVMEHEKFTYVEALRWLATRYNIEIEETVASPEAVQKQQVSESLLIINVFAQKFYASQLWETEDGRAVAYSYLQQRGFTDEIIKQFGIGFAPDTKDAFTSAALKNQFNKELLVRSGLVTERNGNLQDNYRDRIIFPIHNNSGKVIGFGARLIKKNDKAPKYINTPENEVYVKSKILYGNYFARHAIDKEDECLLVEGYTDVVSLHQGGIQNVVASGGTSLTIDQLRLIKKYTKNLTIIYDGDSAGVKAALRGLDMALEEGLNVRMVLVPDGEDPDSYLQKVGAEAFRDFIKLHKKDFVLFQLQVSLKDAGTDAQKKADVVNQVAQTIAKIDRTEDFTKQQDYIRQSAQLLHIDESGLTTLVNKAIRDKLAKEDKSLPFEEAQYHQEKAIQGERTDFDDATFALLFKEELQEREIARVLLEHGMKRMDNQEIVAEYIFNELPEEELFQSEAVLRLIHKYQQTYEQEGKVDKSLFLYSSDPALSTLTVALLHFPYEQSHRWKEDLSESSGYQPKLFKQDYKDFIRAVKKEGKEELASYLNTQKDTTFEEVESAINYLKLRKVRKLLLQNQADMEAADASNLSTFILTHQHLKRLEMELTKKIGTVVIR